MDAVVTDQEGRHITGLKPEDFRIFEDGKPQKITHFSFIEAESRQSAPSPPATAPGAKLSYDSTIYGELVDQSGSATKLDMEVRVFRGLDRIFSSPPIAIPAQQPPEIHAAGEIRLPPDLAPGNYAVQLLVYDPRRKRVRRPNSGWISRW